MDKIYTKRIWVTEGLPTPGFSTLRRGEPFEHLPGSLGWPLMLKAPHEGSTIGITKAESPEQLRQGVDLALRYDDTVLVEQFVQGRELTVAILCEGFDARALPVIEIVAPAGNYDYQNKYFTDEVRYLCPAPLDAALSERVRSIALKAFQALGCSGWARVDLMLGQADQAPMLLEINTSPGMTDHSLVPMAARAAGIDYDELCMRILAGASLKIHEGVR
jgi:D-alanine-D-alanine ligase